MTKYPKISHCAAALETDKTIVVLLVDLRRESECNRVENYVAIEATEVGRQRAEVAQWTFERIKNSLNNRQTLLSGNSSFFVLRQVLPWDGFDGSSNFEF